MYTWSEKTKGLFTVTVGSNVPVGEVGYLGTAGILQSCKNTRQNALISCVSFYHAFYKWTHLFRQHSDECFYNIDILNLNPSACQILFFACTISEKTGPIPSSHSSIKRLIPSYWQQQVPFKRFSILGVTANAIYIMVLRSSGSHRPPWRLEKPLLLRRRGGDSPDILLDVGLLLHINHKDHPFHIVTLVFAIDQLGLYFTR